MIRGTTERKIEERRKGEEVEEEISRYLSVFRLCSYKFTSAVRGCILFFLHSHNKGQREALGIRSAKTAEVLHASFPRLLLKL